MANRLRSESSPYLLQHADNPVDWYPWGKEALERARREDRPILLSIGYSACHWCHVMAHESFEDEETARAMNEHFVNIKVDREERPDLDGIYMDAVQALTGHGGWPLTVFLTPEGKPFYGGTYFPPVDRHSLPSFRRVLATVAEAYTDRREQVEAAGDDLVGHLAGMPISVAPDILERAVLEEAFKRMRRSFDWQQGGFGRAPKFPQPMLLDFLLRLHRAGIGSDPLSLAERTLRHMAAGGIYDQLGGGFHRYSVDASWTVPHFEKMLYDNAQLARVYSHAFQVTGHPLYRRVAEETLDYVRREMTTPEGAFYSAQDADSEGREGAYFVWTPAQVMDLLGADDGKLACFYFGISAGGNFEGENVLTRRHDDDRLAEDMSMPLPELQARIDRARRVLLAARERRPRPGTDDKVLAGWNGLMLSAFAQAGAALDRADYLEVALANARFLRDRLAAGERLWHSADDREPRTEGFLQDYALVAEGLLSLYRATLRGEWLAWARELGRRMVANFWSEVDNCFFETGAGHEALVVRPRNVFDNAIPAGASVATLVLYHLATIDGDESFRRVADAAARGLVEIAAAQPLGFGQWLAAFDFATARPADLALLGEPDNADARALLRVVHAGYHPNLVVLGEQGAERSPLLRHRVRVGGRPTAYYCENFVCREPVTDPAALAALLEP